MRFTSCPLACAGNDEIHEWRTHYIFSSVEHVGAIGANLIASAENSSRSTVYEPQTSHVDANVAPAEIYGPKTAKIDNIRHRSAGRIQQKIDSHEGVVLQRISASSSSPPVMRFKACALACTGNVEIHMRGAHYIFSLVEHVGAIGANLIASAENSSRSTVYESQTLSRWR